ncbi:hypothetical protein EBZ39_19695 [bacterium]|nr:hypothetical protein [bacterium]
MNHLLAWFITIVAFAGMGYPIIKYITNKYYYIDTTPIRYWLNKKQKISKRYKTYKKRNKKHLVVNKIIKVGSYNKYSNTRLTKVNK